MLNTTIKYLLVSTLCFASTACFDDVPDSDEEDGAETLGQDSTADSGDGSEDYKCAETCDLFVLCFEDFPLSHDECVGNCMEEADAASEQGDVCAAATAELHACMSGLDCGELEDYTDMNGDPYPCQDLDAATC